MLLIYALCITVGGIGNAVTLITMATADRKTKTVTNVFLISLAVGKKLMMSACHLLLLNILKAFIILALLLEVLLLK